MSLALYDYIMSTNRDSVHGTARTPDSGIGIVAHRDYTETLFFHLEGSSWITGDGKIIMYAFNHLSFILFVTLMVLTLLYFRGWQMARQREMKNVNGVLDFSSIVLSLAVDEVSSRAVASRARIVEKYYKSKERLLGAIRADNIAAVRVSKNRAKDKGTQKKNKKKQSS